MALNIDDTLQMTKFLIMLQNKSSFHHMKPLRIQTQSITGFQNFIKNYNKVKISKVILTLNIDEGKHDEVEIIRLLKCFGAAVKQSQIKSLELSYGFYYTKIDDLFCCLEDMASIRTLSLPLMDDNKIAEILKGCKELKSISLTLNNSQSLKALKVIYFLPKNLRNLRIVSKGSNILTTPDLFKAISGFKLEKFSLQKIKGDSFCKLATQYEFYPKKLCIVQGCVFDSNNHDLKELGRYFSQVKLVNKKLKESIAHKPNTLKMTTLEFKNNQMKVFLEQMNEITVMLANESPIILSQEEYDEMTNSINTKSKIEHLTVTVDPYDHNNSQSATMIQFLLNIAPNLKSLTLDNISADVFPIEEQYMEFKNLSLRKLSSINIVSCNKIAILILGLILQQEHNIKSIFISGTINEKQLEQVLELVAQSDVGINKIDLFQCGIKRKFDQSNQSIIQKEINPLQRLQSLSNFSFNSSLFEKSEVLDYFLDHFLSKCKTLIKLGVNYNLIHSKLWITEEVKTKIATIINEKLPNLKYLQVRETYCNQDNLMTILDMLVKVQRRLYVTIDNEISLTNYSKLSETLSQHSLHFQNITVFKGDSKLKDEETLQGGKFQLLKTYLKGE